MDDRELLTFCIRKWLVPSRTLMFSMVLMANFIITDTSVKGDQPHWIWSPMKTGAVDLNSQGDCHFRKKFTLIRPEKAVMEITAGDEYEIFINGRLATRGQSFGSTSKMDVAAFMQPGVNLVAVKVRHHDGKQVGLALRIRMKERGETRWRSLTTDATWKTRIAHVEAWRSSAYNDMGWLKAQALGELRDEFSSKPTAQTLAPESMAAPGKQVVQFGLSANTKSDTELSAQATNKMDAPMPAISASPETLGSAQSPVPVHRISAATHRTYQTTTPENKRFEIDPQFSVQKVLAGSETGSLIAMEFNEFGKLLLSREGGPLLIADPTKQLTDPMRVRVCCDEVNTCQGILALNGNVYVTGSGPEGLGLYRLSDTNRDGMLEVQQKLVGFTGSLGEHGPHGIQLGPDGMLYVIIGNSSQLDGPADASSPYQHFYEGDLVPRYEDPGGHAKGVKAPGGTVVRVSVDGKKIETVAGGIRNAYDLVFDHQGEMFIHDSDMESDIGTTWYRPTMIFHVPAGAEFGWRSGWAKFPQHFIDQTPAVCKTGRGSPAGAVLYQHLKFPPRYQDAMFFADWSEGRILSLRTKHNGAGYAGQAETFLKGRPLNVVDLAVGEDGGLYFCTGGRGTEGGVYRVMWKGKIPDKVLDFESDLARAIRHPQPNSAWARQNIAQLKIAIGDKWNTAIEGVAQEKRNTTKFRLRALQIMVLYGPAPSEALLNTLSQDDSPEIRAQIAFLCGLNQDDNNQKVLNELVVDTSPLVRRKACEAFMRLGVEPELSAILPMINSTDRIESLCARRLIERIPAEQWESEIFTTDEKRLFIQGSVALMTADPTLERAYKVLAQASKFMEGFVNDYDFINLLRAMELALVRGQVEPAHVPGLVERLGNEFPSGSPAINRELVRLLAFLQAGDLQGRVEEYLQNEAVSVQDKIHLGMHMQSIGAELKPGARLAIIDSLEQAQSVKEVGGSYSLYLQQAVKDIAKTITEDQVKTVLSNGDRWPNAVVAAFYKMPEKLDQEMVQLVIDLDQSIKQAGKTDPVTNQVRLGVIAILARSGDKESMDYLRQLWQQEEDRRNDIVIGLSQQPEAENWAYLVSSLPVLDDLTGVEVVQKLIGVTRRPREARHFRDLISIGYRLRGQDNKATVRLLEHWAGEKLTPPADDWQSMLNAWRQWFHQKWPDEEPVSMEAQNEVVGQYSVDQLLTHLEMEGPGNARMGHAAFVKAQCATCHQVNGQGQAVGPELTSLAHRFSLREAIEATIDPSKVISDRYASKTILTTDGMQFSGITIEQSDGSYLVLQSDSKRIRINAADVEAVKPNSNSAMPEGLLDALTVTEINNMFAYLLKAQQETAEKDKNSPLVSQSEFTTDRTTAR